MFKDLDEYIPIASGSNLQFQPQQHYNNNNNQFQQQHQQFLSNQFIIQSSSQQQQQQHYQPTTINNLESFCCTETDCSELALEESCEECPTTNDNNHFLNWDQEKLNNLNCEGCLSGDGILEAGQQQWNSLESFNECCTEDCFDSNGNFTQNGTKTNKLRIAENILDCKECWEESSTIASGSDSIIRGVGGHSMNSSSSLTESSSGAETPSTIIGGEIEFGEILKGLDEQAIQNIIDCCCCGIDGQQLQELDPTISSHYPNLNFTPTLLPSYNSFPIPNPIPTPTFPCKWSGCELLFQNKEGLVSHVNEDHLFLPPSLDKIKFDNNKCLWDDCNSGILMNHNRSNSGSSSVGGGGGGGLIAPTIAETLQQLPAPTSALLQHLLQVHLEGLQPAQDPFTLLSHPILPSHHQQQQHSLPLPLPTPYQHQHILVAPPHQHLTVHQSPSLDPLHAHPHPHPHSHPHSHDHQHEHPHPPSKPKPHAHHSHTHTRPTKPHKHTHPYGVRPLKSTTTSSSTPSHSPSLSIPPQSIPASNSSFGCNWKGCQLHFNTTSELMSHLSSFHVGFGKSSYICEWLGCDDSSIGGGGKKGGRRGSNESLGEEGDGNGNGAGSSCTGGVGGGGRVFAQRQKIMRHLQTHTGDRPFVCDTCGKSFSEATTLTQHIRTHTAEKPYPCTFDGCNKAFSLASALTIHNRTHTGDKPFSCPHPGCSSTFSESSNLSKHIKTHSGEKLFECDFFGCEKRFGRSDQLSRHRKIHIRKGSKVSLDLEMEMEVDDEAETERDGEGSDEESI